MRTSSRTPYGTEVFFILNARPKAQVVTPADQFTGEVADTITLEETERHRRRLAMTTDGGVKFLLDLPEARLLLHGDILHLSDGRAVEVRAAPEALLLIRGKDARHLLSLAWQIGNRHLAAAISSDHILIRRDHVIEDMLIGLGADVEKVVAAFNPETGAYDHHHHHHHV